MDHAKLVFIFCFMLLSNTSSMDMPKSIIILAGQSNMSGRGGVKSSTIWDGVVPPECQPNPMILRLSANLSWEEAQEPLHRDIDTKKVCGVGPGMPFANSILARDPSIGIIGLVPCAIGATSISQWGRGSDLYNTMLSRAQAALFNGGGVIRAILWYQGEGDLDSVNAPLYKSRLQQFIQDVRCDLLSPLLPVIEVAITVENFVNELDIIRKAQLETGEEVMNVRCVDAMGLPFQPGESVHLSTPGQVKLGRMMADAFLQIEYGLY